MSQVKISGNASGTGTFTIAAPNSNTDRTLTLPDSAGTIVTREESTPFAFWYLTNIYTLTGSDYTPVSNDLTITSSGITTASGSSNFVIQETGVYQIIFTLTAGRSVVERQIGCTILVNGNNMALARDQISVLESDSSFGGCTASWVGVLNASDYVSFKVQRSYSDGNAEIIGDKLTHGSIVRIGGAA